MGLKHLLKPWIPAPLLPPLRKCRDYLSSGKSYDARLQTELETYAAIECVHELPAIATYWINKHLLPILQPFGFANSIELFRGYLARICREQPSQTAAFLSIGSGDSAPEINIARWLLENGIENFSFECLDINPHVLERAQRGANENGVQTKFTFAAFDINSWRPRSEYMAVLAFQSLHHFLELEVLFEKVYEALHPDGFFMADDMIGRNGHQRWPEALKLVKEFWKELPVKYKYNHSLRRVETGYDNWDCSKVGFEGIRAQDILPLLIRRFHFELFVAFGNVIDVFIDRGFGPNFDPANEWDCGFIDRVHAVDRIELESGRIKPTHMYAVMTKRPVGKTRCHQHMTPDFCVRR